MLCSGRALASLLPFQQPLNSNRLIHWYSILVGPVRNVLRAAEPFVLLKTTWQAQPATFQIPELAAVDYAFLVRSRFFWRSSGDRGLGLGLSAISIITFPLRLQPEASTRRRLAGTMIAEAGSSRR